MGSFLIPMAWREPHSVPLISRLAESVTVRRNTGSLPKNLNEVNAEGKASALEYLKHLQQIAWRFRRSGDTLARFIEAGRGFTSNASVTTFTVQIFSMSNKDSRCRTVQPGWMTPTSWRLKGMKSKVGGSWCRAQGRARRQPILFKSCSLRGWHKMTADACNPCRDASM